MNTKLLAMLIMSTTLFSCGEDANKPEKQNNETLVGLSYNTLVHYLYLKETLPPSHRLRHFISVT